MDVVREKKVDRRPQYIAGGALLLIVITSAGISRLKDAPPTVERAAISVDTVESGAMIREVRAPGTLVPEQIRWISAVAPGRVERKLVQPGARVTASTVLMELSNPDVEIQLLQAERQLTDAEAQLVSLRISLETQRLTQAGVVAQVRSQHLEAMRQSKAARELVAQQLVSEFEAAKSRILAEL